MIDCLFWLDFVLPFETFRIAPNCLYSNYIAGYFYPAHRHILFADYSVFKEPIAQCDVRYIITSSDFCQTLFFIFSNFFRENFFGNISRGLMRGCVDAWMRFAHIPFYASNAGGLAHVRSRQRANRQQRFRIKSGMTH